MEMVLAVVVGGLFAAGLYTILRRSIVRLAMGLVLLSHAANLLIFTAAGVTRDAPPILSPDDVATGVTPTVADPLPQALVLTAIVIGFGVLAFTLVLVHRVYQVVGSDDVDNLTSTDQLPGGDGKVRSGLEADQRAADRAEEAAVRGERAPDADDSASDSASDRRETGS